MSPNSIPRSLMEQILERAMTTGADYAELYLEHTGSRSIHLMNGSVYSISDQLISGAGIRIYMGLRSVFASTSDLTRKGLLACADRVAGALAESVQPAAIHLRERIFGDIHPVRIVPADTANRDKIDVLKEACEAAGTVHETISQVSGVFLDVDHRIQVANSEGLLASDRQIRSRLTVSATASLNGENQSGSCSHGHRVGFELCEMIEPRAVGVEAATQAVTMLNAGYCPAGKMTVAIGNGFGGVIFHEACGHSLEAASVAYGQSEFAGKLGQQVANPKVTAVDDGTIPNEWGSMNIDDEGTPARKNVLIENGILKSYMIDKFNARRMGLPATGNSRRQGYDYEPTSRMTNTYIAPGTDSDEDIISSIEYGLYAKKMGGGSVNPITGEFNFGVAEAYMIRGGKICEPVRGASLVGKGSDVIRKIDMVGKDLQLAAGMCGASSGRIPTTVGQPLIRVSDITVGGRNQ